MVDEGSAEVPQTKVNLVEILDASHVREVIWSSDAKTQALFKTHFGEEIERSIQILGGAYSTFQRLQSSVVLDQRTATVQMFIHVALVSVVASIHHLVSGYPIAAGHMMRQFTESIAMALMCSTEATGVYQWYIADRERFPVQKGPGMLRRPKIREALKESLSFDPSGWETVLEIGELYDALSHASPTALGFHILFTEPGGLIMGSEFDPEKVDAYRSDISRRRSAAQSLANVIPILMRALPQKVEKPE